MRMQKDGRARLRALLTPMRLECAPLKSTTVEGEDGVTYYLYETSRIGAPRQQQPKGGDEVREHDPPANVNFDACQCRHASRARPAACSLQSSPPHAAWGYAYTSVLTRARPRR